MLPGISVLMVGYCDQCVGCIGDVGIRFIVPRVDVTCAERCIVRINNRVCAMMLCCTVLCYRRCCTCILHAWFHKSQGTREPSPGTVAFTVPARINIDQFWILYRIRVPFVDIRYPHSTTQYLNPESESICTSLPIYENKQSNMIWYYLFKLGH